MLLSVSVLFGQYTHEFTLLDTINDGGLAQAIALTPEGNVFLANGDDGLRVYSFDGNTFSNIAHINDFVDQVDPQEVAVGSNGTVFFGNYFNGLRAYSHEGDSLELLAHLDIPIMDFVLGPDETIYTATAMGGYFRHIGAYSYEDSSFNLLVEGGASAANHHITLGVDGTIFVVHNFTAEYFHHAIEAFCIDGDTIIPIDWLISTETVGCVNNIATDPDGKIYVSPSMSPIKVFSFEDSTFSLIDSIDCSGECVALTVNNDGTIFISTLDSLGSYIYDDQTSSYKRTASIELPLPPYVWQGDIEVGENGIIYVAHGSKGLIAYSYSPLVGTGEIGANVPRQMHLNQNYPNPFNPTTIISYDLPTVSDVALTVYDITGREVRTLQKHEQPAGHYEIQWNGVDNSGNPVSTGLYFARLLADDYSRTIKMVYLE